MFQTVSSDSLLVPVLGLCLLAKSYSSYVGSIRSLNSTQCAQHPQETQRVSQSVRIPGL